MSPSRSAGAGLGDMRRTNELAVLEELWRASPRTRSDLAAATGLTKPTISAALVNLVDAGLVIEGGGDAPTAKYGGRLFAAAGRQHPVVGLDIGARFVRAQVGGLDGTVLATADRPVASLTFEAVLTAATEVRDAVLGEAGIEPSAIAGVGIGVPGVFDTQADVIRQPGEIEGLEGDDATTRLRALFPGAPVVFENDVNSAVIAEHRLGAGQHLDDFALVSVGTGVGAALVLRGALYRGGRGGAGEVDPMFARDSVPPQLRSPAAAALIEYAIDEGFAIVTEPSAGGGPPSLEEVFEAAEHGEPSAVELVDEAARRIAALCIAVISVVDVETVVLAGGVGRAVAPDHPLLVAELARLIPWPTRLVTTELGSSGTVAGARLLGMDVTRRRLIEERIGKSLYRPVPSL